MRRRFSQPLLHVLWTLVLTTAAGCAPDDDPESDTAPSADAGDVADSDAVAPSGEFAAPARLTNAQYQRAIASLFPSAEGPLRVLPGGEEPFAGSELEPMPEVSVQGFYNDLESQAPNSLFVGRLQSNALAVSTEVLQRAEEYVACEDPDRSVCGLQYIQDLASRAWRVPEDHPAVLELQGWIADDIPQEGVESAVSAGIAWIVSSPRFIYVLDDDRDAEIACEETPPSARATATRLALTLWGDLPDEALIESADAGDLQSAEGVRLAAATMLRDERAAAALHDFSSIWLQLVGFESETRQTPGGEPLEAGAASALIEQAQLFVSRTVLDDSGSYRDLLTSPHVPVDTRTVRFHPGAMIELEGWSTFDGSAEGRAGVLTLPAVLARGANDLRGSPVKRGHFVVDRLLCTPLPPPPGNVDTSLGTSEESGPQTNRERYDEHQANPACSSCHQSMDPLGFPFEHFNASGQYRELEPWWDDTELASDFEIEELLPIDASVSLPDGAAGHFRGFEIDGSVDLAEAVAGSEAAHACFAQTLSTWALGRPVQSLVGGSELVEDLTAQSLAGAPVTDLLMTIVSDDLFLYRCGA